MTVLVTGAAGFIGSHLCDRLLSDGHEVVAVDDLSTGRLDNLASARERTGFRFHDLDVVGDAGRVLGLMERERPDVVMHLAAQSSVRLAIEDPGRDAGINILGSINVLEAASTSGVRKIVYAASGGTMYGEPEILPVVEAERRGPFPTSPYGISKKVVEEYLRFFRSVHGLDFTMLALANVYGPRQDPRGEAGVVALFASRMLCAKPPVIFGDGRQTRDFIFVADVVDAFIRACTLGSGETVNVGTGVGTSVADIYRLLAEIVGFLGEPANGPLPPGDLRRLALSCEAAERILDWKPRTSLPDGLARTVASLSRHVQPLTAGVGESEAPAWEPTG